MTSASRSNHYSRCRYRMSFIANLYLKKLLLQNLATGENSMQFMSMSNRMFAGVAMWVLVLAVPLQAQKIAYDPDADLLGRPQKEYLGEYASVATWAAEIEQHLTFRTQCIENQKGPVLFPSY